MSRIQLHALTGLCLLAFLPSSAPLRAADAPVLRSKSFEVGGFGGASYGADDFRFMGGANVTYALTRRILPYAEYSYFPGIGRKLTGTIPSSGNPYSSSFSLPLSDFHGGIHYRIIIREKPIVPYLVFGAGALSSFETTVKATLRDSNNVSTTFSLPLASTNNPAINFGGGVRYYATQRYGFRIEAKMYKPFSNDIDALNKFFSKIEAGFFIQLR